MKSIKGGLKELIGSNPIKEIRSYFCEGCGEEIKVKEITIFAGPQKGERVQREIGCKCFEIAEARQALEDHKRFLSGNRN